MQEVIPVRLPGCKCYLPDCYPLPGQAMPEVVPPLQCRNDAGSGIPHFSEDMMPEMVFPTSVQQSLSFPPHSILPTNMFAATCAHGLPPQTPCAPFQNCATEAANRPLHQKVCHQIPPSLLPTHPIQTHLRVRYQSCSSLTQKFATKSLLPPPHPHPLQYLKKVAHGPSQPTLCPPPHKCASKGRKGKSGIEVATKLQLR